MARFAAVLGALLALLPATRAAGADSSGGDAGARAESEVRLSLSAPTTRGAWTIRVTNGGDVPVRIAADARVLTLEVTARGARSPVRCQLPEDMRPENGDLDRPLVVPPGRSYAESFEARLYCFGETKAAALAPGSIVVARLGWAGKHPRDFEVAPIDGVEPRITALGEIEALPVVLPDDRTLEPHPLRRSAVAGGAEAANDGAAARPEMSIKSVGWVDVASMSAIEVPVTLHNDGTHAVMVRFRPEVLRFEVVGPRGVDHCTWPVPIGAPSREQFTALAPSASTSLVATLPSFCDPRTFDSPGAFFVRAGMDTRQTGGAIVGLRAFEGELVANESTVLRLHKGRAPAPAPRPKLEHR